MIEGVKEMWKVYGYTRTVNTRELIETSDLLYDLLCDIVFDTENYSRFEVVEVE